MLSARPESPRMFDSDFVDFFSRTPWWSIPLFWGPISTGLVGYGIVSLGVSWHIAALQLVLGAIFWTLSEYWLHRTLFHWEPDNDIGRRFHYIVHGVHHDLINDPYRLVMPPAAGVIIASFFWFGYQGLAALMAPLFAPTWVPAFMGGFLMGYIAYDMIHYATHHAKLKNKWLKKLRQHHMKHHFGDSEKRFGITTFVWDRVFRTI